MRITGLVGSTALALLIAALSVPSISAQGAKTAMQADPACQSLTPVAAGGPAPRDMDTLVVRWLGITNYELAYRGNVFLLDAHFDQLSRRPRPGVTVADLKKATAVFVGHGHFDRSSDAPAIAKQSGATVIGAVAGNAEYLKRNNVPGKQFRAVKSGDVLQYPGVTVEAVVGTHADPTTLKLPPDHLEKQQAALKVATLQEPLTAAEEQHDAAIRAKTVADPRIASEGVINYLFTFGNNFRLMFIDSHGGITDAQRQLAARVPAVDVAMLPYLYYEAGIPALLELVNLTHPSTVFLGNQDGIGTMGWASNYPPALAIRDASPKTRTMDVIYRTPVCFNTTTKEMIIGW